MATTLGTARGGCVGVSPWHKNLGRARRVLGLSDHMPPDGGFLVASARLDAPCRRSTSAWHRSPQRTPKASRRWSLACAVGASDSFDTTEPTYPEAVGLLYIIYVLNCVLERGWRFAQPLLLALADGGFGAIALLGLVGQLSLFVSGPVVGATIDRVDRAYAVNLAMVVQIVGIVVSVLLVQRMLLLGVPVQSTILYPALILASVVERVSAFASDVALERDWVVALCGANRTGALATANGNLRRADQISEFGTSLLVGYSVTQFSMETVVAGTVAVNVLLGSMVIFLVQQVVRMAPKPMACKEPTALDSSSVLKDLRRGSGDTPGTKQSLYWTFQTKMYQWQQNVVSTWRTYFSQPAVPTSNATVLLYFNAVMSPGGLMTAYLTTAGCTATLAAVFRSSCAVLGFIGTVIGGWTIPRFGVFKTGLAAVFWQAATLTAAAAVYVCFLRDHAALVVGPMFFGTPAWVVVFCAFIILSRIGLWMFDMAHAQILQQNVAEKEMSTVGGVELSFCSLAELCTLGIAALVADRSGGFTILVLLSCVAVTGSAVLFSSWVFSGEADRMNAQSLSAMPTAS